MKYLILALLLVLASGRLHSQDLNGKKINLRANTSVNGQLSHLETTCFKRDMKIKFKVRDSISYQKLSADTLYQSLSKLLMSRKFDARNDTVLRLVKRLDSIHEEYSVYKTDSIIVKYKDFPAYGELLNTMFSSSQKELENQTSNKNRIVLHGTLMQFIFSKNGSLQKTVFAHSPNEKSHPLLYDYIRSSIKIFQKTNSQSFLDKGKIGNLYVR